MEPRVPEPWLPPAALPQLESHPRLLSPAHRWRRDLVAPEAESQAKRPGIVSGLPAGPSCRCWADSSTSLLPGEAAGAAPKLLWFPARRSPGRLPLARAPTGERRRGGDGVVAQGLLSRSPCSIHPAGPGAIWWLRHGPGTPLQSPGAGIWDGSPTCPARGSAS